MGCCGGSPVTATSRTARETLPCQGVRSLPQPAIIVVDQAEELLCAYRADFLVGFYNLAKETRDDDMLRLVLVINSDNAVKALKLMNGGDMFSVIQAPKVSRDAVRD